MVKLTLKKKKELYKKWKQSNKPNVKKFSESEHVEYKSMLAIIAIAESKWMRVIQLTGYPRVGKDSFIEIVIKHFPKLKIYTIAYADKLKTMHMEELKIPNLKAYNLMLHDNILYKRKLNIRKDLSRFSDTIKKKNPNYFTNIVMDKISNLTDVDLVIVSDLRYSSEYEYAKSNNHVIVRIDRGKILSKDKKQPWNVLVETFKPDFVISNNGTLKEYSSNVINCVNNILSNT